jgi:hypothetical protein
VAGIVIDADPSSPSPAGAASAAPDAEVAALKATLFAERVEDEWDLADGDALKAACAARGVSAEGADKELRQRLREADAKKAAVTTPEPPAVAKPEAPEAAPAAEAAPAPAAAAASEAEVV